jgi:hypothetical protein
MKLYTRNVTPKSLNTCSLRLKCTLHEGKSGTPFLKPFLWIAVLALSLLYPQFEITEWILIFMLHLYMTCLVYETQTFNVYECDCQTSLKTFFIRRFYNNYDSDKVIESFSFTQSPEHDVSDYINLFVRIAHIICNHPSILQTWRPPTYRVQSADKSADGFPGDGCRQDMHNLRDYLKANQKQLHTSRVINQSSYEGVTKSFRTGRLERELQMIQLSTTRYSCIAILWVSLVSFAAITLCVASQTVFIFISLSI